MEKKKHYSSKTFQYHSEVCEFLNANPEVIPISITFRGNLASGQFYLFYFYYVAV